MPLKTLYNKLYIKFSGISRFVVDLVFPMSCLGCGREGAWLCGSCWQKIAINGRQHCAACHRPNRLGNYCGRCSPDYSLKGILIAADYADPLVSGLIKHFKFRLVADLGRICGQLLVACLERFPHVIYAANEASNEQRIIGIAANRTIQSPLLIPVPLHPRRERFRGFNQAEILARSIAGHWPLAVNHLDLRRKVFTRPQSKLRRKARIHNISGCFEWRGKDLHGRPILLIDDVVTSGATLNECGRVLKAHGAGEIWGIAVAQN